MRRNICGSALASLPLEGSWTLAHMGPQLNPNRAEGGRGIVRSLAVNLRRIIRVIVGASLIGGAVMYAVLSAIPEGTPVYVHFIIGGLMLLGAYVLAFLEEIMAWKRHRDQAREALRFGFTPEMRMPSARMSEDLWAHYQGRPLVTVSGRDCMFVWVAASRERMPTKLWWWAGNQARPQDIRNILDRKSNGARG